MLMPAARRSATAAKTPALNRSNSTTRNRWGVSKAAGAAGAAAAVVTDKDNISVMAIAIVVTTDVAVAINADVDSAVVAADRDKGNNKVADNAAIAASNARHSHQSFPIVKP
jgi:hypothetical protein